MNPFSSRWLDLARGLLCVALLAGAARGATTGDRPAPLQLKPRAAVAISNLADNPAGNAIDGVVSDGSRWVSQPSRDPLWIELELGAEHRLAGIHLHSGFGGASPIRDFVVQFRRDGRWQDIPSAKFENNRATALAIPFDDAVAVITDRLRLWITGTPDGYARIAEIVVWPATAGGVPPLAARASSSAQAPGGGDSVPLVYLNQSGFNRGKPKRFTAPTLPDGTPFEVRAAAGGAALFRGTLQGQIGDFSAFDPADGRDYVVVAGPHTSVPFRVGDWWLERVTYQNALNFMIDSRHHVGNVRVRCPGSFGWRDDHHFGWELHTLVPQFLSNPSAYARLPRQVTYEPPTDPTLWGRLAPPDPAAPDLVKLIHWGADVIVTQQLQHEHLKAQLAYFLYAWPWLKAWLPAQNYEAVRDYAFGCWSVAACTQKYPYDESPEHDLLALKTKLGTTKGCYPPGFSVEPNLMLYAVARREGRADAEQYFAAAFRQAEWLVANLDWNDPQTTKGQRMSEFITVTGLAHFLQEFPERAPAGLAAKLNAWADVVVRRSANLWDFRKLDDGDRWTPMGEKPTMWNEPGNVVGLPAALLAAQPFITNAATRARLEQLVWSHFDNMFGRNPAGRHFSYDAPREIEGVEHGWYSFLPGGIGRLAEARFVIDGSPKNPHYPYHPEVGNVGWTEGWVQFNTAFNISLAWLAFAETKVHARVEGGELLVRLEAPLNFDPAKVESGTIVVTTSSGDEETVTVTEESADSRFLSARIRLRPARQAVKADGLIQAAPGATVDVAYGFGYLGRRATVRVPR